MTNLERCTKELARRKAAQVSLVEAPAVVPPTVTVQSPGSTLVTVGRSF